MTAVATETSVEHRRDRLISWGLFGVAFFVLLFTEKAAGFVRDESFYFYAAENHAGWFRLLFSSPTRAFSDAGITQFFEYNHEHPAGMKNLYGLSFLIFSEGLHLLRPAAAFRVPAFAVAALILPLTYLLAKPRFGRNAAMFAALTWLLIPRQFFESHIACFDVPVASVWLLVVYCYWQALTRPRFWLYTGLAFGAALATKHNAYFIPVVLVPFSIVVGWVASNGKTRARVLFAGINAVFVAAVGLYALMVAVLGPEAMLRTFDLPSAQLAIFLIAVSVGSWLLWQLRKEDEQTFRAIAPLVAMAGLGPVIFYLHWPYLWHHPVERTAWYFAFHLRHDHYAWLYLGELLRGPPFPLLYVWVKTALTVPTSLFVPMMVGLVVVVIGLFRRTDRQHFGLDVLLVMNALMSIALISAPNVPHFGGVKHWFPSMPFLAILGAGSLARGTAAVAAWLESKKRPVGQNVVFAVLALLAFVPALIQGVRIYPYGTSAYAELAGGLPGAATLGMQRQFWANNVSGVLEWINANAKQGDRVWFHENHNGQIHDLQRNQMVRADLRFVGSPFEADLVAYQYMQEFREAEFETWQAMGTTKPAFGLYLDETPQIIVYRRVRN